MTIKIISDTSDRDFDKFIGHIEEIGLEETKAAFIQHKVSIDLVGPVAYFGAFRHFLAGSVSPADLLAFWLIGRIDGRDIPEGYDSEAEAFWSLALQLIKVADSQEEAA